MAHILLLESDKLVAANVCDAFKRRGHSVDWQVDPQAATDSADSRKPDLIILDLLLAGRSGVEFLYELRSYPDWQAVPVVVFSNVSQQELSRSAAGAEKLDIAAFLYKPTTSLDELTKTAEDLLQPAKA